MATSLKTSIVLKVSAFLESGVTGESGGVAQSMLDEIITMVDGTSSGQANRSYFATRTLTASSSEVLDVRGGVSDSYGTALHFANIKLIAIKITTDTDSGVDISIGPDATNGAGVGYIWADASDRSIVAEGGVWLWLDKATGCPCAAGSTDEFYVTNRSGSTSVTYRILIIGAT